MSVIAVVEADLENAAHQTAIVELITAYARDPMGGGRDLPEGVRRSLLDGLGDHPTTRIFLAIAGREPVGIAVCFQGFSTFAASPLLNVHDLAVLPAYRGQGVGQRLLEAVETAGRAIGCCKITLEVREDNTPAQRLYRRFGFSGLDQRTGAARMWFLEKRL